MTQDIHQLLSALEDALDQFQRRTEAADPSSPVVKYLPDWHRAVGPDEVAIGTGLFEPPVSGALARGGICLNDKRAGPALKLGRGFTSVTDLVLHAPEDLFDAWRTVIGADSSPQAFFSRFKLVVEDASPDSCFSLICLLMRIAGTAADAVPIEWVRYIEGWERGEVLVGESIYCAYGCLHNALVHGKIDDDIAGTWVAGLRLVAGALASGAPPVAIPLSIVSNTFVRARALLRFEEQSYEGSLEHATCIQLALPIADAKSRYRLVDAYLAEATLPMGALKAFSRSDREHPFLKNGFTLMAVYRSTPIGDGNDLTISVDQAAGVELKDLWLKLEEAEDRAWRQDRPHDQPRSDLAGYKGGKRPDGRNAPNQPWYDGRDYSLLASPRKLNDGRLGSELSWSDVLELLWQTYQPFQRVRVRPGAIEIAAEGRPAADKLKLLEECWPEVLADDVENDAHTPRLFVAGWYRPDSAAPVFAVTPTFCRYLAACIKRWRRAASAGLVALAELPHESDYDVLKLPGMVAIISQEGAFLVYDGQHLKPPLHEIKNEFEHAARIRHRIERGASDLAMLLDDIKAFFGGRRPDFLEEDLLDHLMTEQVELALELNRAHAAVVSHEARRFRQAVLDRWGIENWLDLLTRDIAQIKDILHGHADLDSSRRMAFLHKYGVPVALAVVLYGFVEAAETLWRWPPHPAGVKWSGLLIFVLLALLIFGFMHGVAGWRRGGMRSISAWRPKSPGRSDAATRPGGASTRHDGDAR